MLLEQGHYVHGTLRDADLATASELPAFASTFSLDMSCAEEVRVRLDKFCGSVDRLDSIAVCTGIADSAPLEIAPLDGVRRMFEINTLSVLAVYQGSLPSLRKTRGTLAIVGSISGIMAIPFLGGYSASKFALEGLADIMRREAYRWGVHVGIVEPGTIRTPMTVNQLAAIQTLLDGLSDEQRTLYGDMFASFSRRVEDRLPSALDPAEVAQAVIGILDGNGVARQPIGLGAVDSVSLARSGNDRAIDDQFRDAFGGSLG